MRGVFLFLYIFIAEATPDYSWSGMETEGTTASYGWNVNSGSQTQAPTEGCDVNNHACGCCIMVQYMSEMEMELNTNLTMLEEETESINNSLSDIQANRVAFSACLKRDTDTQLCEQPTASDPVIKYKHIFLNEGNAYDAATGTFTAPVFGVYSLTVSVYSDSGSSANELAACASLFKNNEMLSSVRDRNTYDSEDSATMVLVVTLDSGDMVTVQLATGCILCKDGKDDGRYNTFSVFMLYSIDV